MTTVRLAHLPGTPAEKSLRGIKGIPQIPESSAPHLLVSYFYIRDFIKHRDEHMLKDWALDSGAFSAHSMNQPISVEEYTDFCLAQMERDPQLTEIFGLDVIGDPKASLRNVEYAWRRGVKAIPTYHRGSPESELLYLCKNYPKVALGGVAMLKGPKKMEWAEQCFARVWPHRLHGFGFGTEKALEKLPWHSVDASSWQMGPSKFGVWRSYGRKYLGVRSKNLNVRAELEFYLRMERDAQRRWRKEMELLEGLPS